jgi:hypothetical protein
MSNLKPGPREIIGVSALVLLFAIQACMSAAQKSLTIDEYTHFGAATAYIQNDDYSLNPNHPPFVKVLTGLSILPLGNKAPEPPREGVKIAQKWYGIRWARMNADEIERITFAGRVPHIAVAVLLGLAVWLSARYFFGQFASMAALLLWSTDPNVLAHARLVHTDSGAAVFVFLTVASLLFLVCRRPSWRRCLVFSMFLSLAVLTKFSTAVLVVILPLVAALWAYGARRGYIDAGTRATHSLRETCPALLRVVAACLLSVVVFATLLYRGNPQWWFSGLGSVLEHNELGHLSYLLGEWSRRGWWYYFIVALAVKTPVPLLGLATLGLAATLRGLWRGRTYEQFVFVLPGLIWFMIAMTSNINIGIRHILPAYVFMFVLAAAGIRQLLSRRWGTIAVAALLCWQGVIAVRTYPDYISYFNEPAGGPGAGMQYLSDSNCDWGQEVLTLRKWMNERGTSRVALYSRAAPAPDIYGVPVVGHLAPPSADDPAFLAVGSRDYGLIMFGETDEYRVSREFLARQERVEHLGHSLLVFRVTEPFPKPFP